jgi:multimeric flavodoxin WrbA
MDEANPRFSGSDHLLGHALASCAAHGVESKMIRLSELKFRACEGYYSKSAHACTWPCSITEMDANDQMDRVYEALVHWADAIIVATPIRWGAGSSLYFKMAERLNCVQNAITIRNQVLIRNKVAGFIIVGGQDNIQGVAGQMLGFFAELGFIFPQFPYVAHSRGWSSEDMERNVEIVRESKELADGAAMLAKRCIDLAQQLIARDEAPTAIVRGGRKAYTLDMEKAELAAGDLASFGAANRVIRKLRYAVSRSRFRIAPAAFTTRSTMMGRVRRTLRAHHR